MDKLPPEILQIICNQLNYSSKRKFIKVNKYIYCNLRIILPKLHLLITDSDDQITLLKLKNLKKYIVNEQLLIMHQDYLEYKLLILLENTTIGMKTVCICDNHIKRNDQVYINEYSDFIFKINKQFIELNYDLISPDELINYIIDFAIGEGVPV